MRRLRLIAVILTAALLLVVALPVAHAGTINVTTFNDVTSPDGLCSLREAVTRANVGTASADCPNVTAAPNTIVLPAGTYTLTQGSHIVIDSAITIQESGGDAIIEADTTANTATWRIFNVASGDSLTLNDVTLQNGGSSALAVSGGCVGIAANGSLTVSNVTFTNCMTGSLSSGGGAIAALQGATIQVSGSTFTSNIAQGATGGGAIYINIGTNGTSASLTVSNSSFTSNSFTGSSNGANGGAISCITCSLSITGTNTFTSNSATSTGGTAFGGAIYLNTDANVSISGSTFTSNGVTSASTARGGAIAVSEERAGNIDISNSVITGSTLTGSIREGGAIYFGDGTLSIVQSRIYSNNINGDGDAIYYESPLDGELLFSCITNNGDTAIFDTSAAGILDASGGGFVGDANWWGTTWGPRISGAGANTGSSVSNGDSINGNGNTVSGSILVDVNLSNASDYNGVPAGDWLTTPPTVAGATCQTCTAVSSVGHGRACS